MCTIEKNLEKAQQLKYLNNVDAGIKTEGSFETKNVLSDNGYW